MKYSSLEETDVFETITPVEKVNGIYFKRDDLFKPFEGSVNGGKLRQCLMLIDKNKNKIQNGIITTSSILSPQQAIIAQVAKHHGVRCTILYGGTSYERLETIEYAKVAKELGQN